MTARLSIDARTIHRLLLLHAAGMPNPRILSCGHNKGVMWRGLPYRLLTLDNRPEHHPDVLASWNDLPRLFPEQRFDVVTIDPPHKPDAGDNSMNGEWHERYGLGTDEVRGRDNYHHLFAPFLEAVRAVLVPRTGIVLAKIADIVHSDVRQWSDLAFVEAARAAGFVACDRALGSTTSPPHNSADQCHMPSLTFWLVLHNGTRCRGPGAKRLLQCHVCQLPMRSARRDKQTCSPRCRQRLHRIARRRTLTREDRQ